VVCGVARQLACGLSLGLSRAVCLPGKARCQCSQPVAYSLSASKARFGLSQLLAVLTKKTVSAAGKGKACWMLQVLLHWCTASAAVKISRCTY
jgi:hypothetical protein